MRRVFINIAAVGVTIFVRLLIGPLCDRFGVRLTYTWLLLLGSIPVFAIGLSHSYESFLFFRLCIGAIGASFVIIQVSTSTMFAANVVGTANATTAGWGNSGGGVTQVLMLGMAYLYYRYGKDTPEGGPIVCSCFSVGRNTLNTAIAQFELRTTAAIGQRLRAGTNCGSCLPELRALLAP